jgi:hypothetical protein
VRPRDWDCRYSSSLRPQTSRKTRKRFRGGSPNGRTALPSGGAPPLRNFNARSCGLFGSLKARRLARTSALPYRRTCAGPYLSRIHIWSRPLGLGWVSRGRRQRPWPASTKTGSLGLSQKRSATCSSQDQRGCSIAGPRSTTRQSVCSSAPVRSDEMTMRFLVGSGSTAQLLSVLNSSGKGACSSRSRCTSDQKEPGSAWLECSQRWERCWSS